MAELETNMCYIIAEVISKDKAVLEELRTLWVFTSKPISKQVQKHFRLEVEEDWAILDSNTHLQEGITDPSPLSNIEVQ